MSLAIEYRVKDQSHRVGLTMADYELIDERIAPSLPGEVAKVFDTGEFGQEVEVSVADVIGAIALIVEWVEANPEKMPYTYQIRADGFEIEGTKIANTFQTGGIGGLCLPGDAQHFYSILCGVNRCTLDKVDTTIKSEMPHIVETIDVREQKQILTTNMGTIHIRKRKARSKLVSELRRLHAFLESQAATTATKIMG